MTAKTITRFTLIFVVLIAIGLPLLSLRLEALAPTADAANLRRDRFETLAADSLKGPGKSPVPAPVPSPTPDKVPRTPVGIPTSPVTGPGLPIKTIDGHAMVLVALKGNYRLEGNLDKEEIKAQREAIAAAQDRVVAAINAETGKGRNPNARVRLKRRFVTVPGLAFELKADVIAELKRLPDVAAVYEDSLNSPALATTTNIVGSRLANHPSLGATGRGQVVAVLDTGIDQGHPFLGPAASWRAPASLPRPGSVWRTKAFVRTARKSNWMVIRARTAQWPAAITARMSRESLGALPTQTAMEQLTLTIEKAWPRASILFPFRSSRESTTPSLAQGPATHPVGTHMRQNGSVDNSSE